MITERRHFLHTFGTIAFSAFIANEIISLPLHKGYDPLNRYVREAGRGILQMSLQANDLDSMHRFYRDVLGINVHQSDKQLILTTGTTQINFQQSHSSQTPVYHWAWAIPHNKFDLAKKWLSLRLNLLRHADGRDEFNFRHVNRKAIYFTDPAGNILELIARFNVDDRRKGAFGISDFLYVNHLGLVVDDVEVALMNIQQQTDLSIIGQPTRNFGKIGDENRHLVLVPKKRKWLPENQIEAAVFPTDVTLAGSHKRKMQFSNSPYQIRISP